MSVATSNLVPAIPLTEFSDNPRKIPQAIFIENTEAWVEKYTSEAIIAEMNELYTKYKFMESQLIRGRDNLKVKMPDIKKTLEMVNMLQEKFASEDEAQKSMDANFLISDNIWAKAKIANNTGRVGLWLGANVMVEYNFEEAITILNKNMANAVTRLVQTDDDLNYLKD
jgi:prefoldin subunit 5